MIIYRFWKKIFFEFFLPFNLTDLLTYHSWLTSSSYTPIDSELVLHEWTEKERFHLIFTHWFLIIFILLTLILLKFKFTSNVTTLNLYWHSLENKWEMSFFLSDSFGSRLVNFIFLSPTNLSFEKSPFTNKMTYKSNKQQPDFHLPSPLSCDHSSNKTRE